MSFYSNDSITNNDNSKFYLYKFKPLNFVTTDLE